MKSSSCATKATDVPPDEDGDIDARAHYRAAAGAALSSIF